LSQNARFEHQHVSGLEDASALRRHPYDDSQHFRTKFRMMYSGFSNWAWPTALLLLAWVLGRGPRILKRLWDLPVVLRPREGPKLRSRLRDIPGPGDVYGLAEYDFNGIDWGEVHHVIDAGANVGAFTLWVTVRARCHVVSLEPNPETFALLRENIEGAGIQSRVKLENVALAGARGRRTLHLHQYSTAASLEDQSDSHSAVQVETSTLGDVIMQSGFPHVDLLKIDIEGAEYEVFSDPDLQALDRVRFIILECHLGMEGDYWHVISRMQRRGFEVALEIKPTYVLLLARKPVASGARFFSWKET
jgi:FkbM family methyltransferase